MNLYLVRHADAEKTQPGKRDQDRRLTKEGKVRIQNAANQWINIIKGLDYICTSPYTRAVETADIIAKTIKYEKDIIKDKALSSGSYTKDLIVMINTLEGDNILIVGHQPDLSEHVSNLISAKGALIEFKKAAIAKISFNGKADFSKGYLEFLIPPGTF